MRRLLPLLALLATAVLLTACGGSTSDDRPNADATLMLDFTPNAAHAGIYSAVAHGFDDAEGVHLKVRVPGSSTDAVKLLLSGRTQFSVMDIHDLALAGARGRDLVAVMSIVQRPLAAVLATPDVKSPRELAGRKVGVTGLPSDDAVLRSIVAGAGGDYARSSASRSASTPCPRCSVAESPARPPSGTSRASRSEASVPACTTSASTPTAPRPTPSSCW